MMEKTFSIFLYLQGRCSLRVLAPTYYLILSSCIVDILLCKSCCNVCRRQMVVALHSSPSSVQLYQNPPCYFRQEYSMNSSKGGKGKVFCDSFPDSCRPWWCAKERVNRSTARWCRLPRMVALKKESKVISGARFLYGTPGKSGVDLESQSTNWFSSRKCKKIKRGRVCVCLILAWIGLAWIGV